MNYLFDVANGDRRKSSELKIFRDKAYTRVKESVDNIRTVGKFVFWRSPDRLFGYSSAYNAKNNRVRKNQPSETTEQ